MYYWRRDQESKLHQEWERTRLSTYFILASQMTRKSRFNYDRFTKEYWPFVWEKTLQTKEQKENPYEGVMSFDAWHNILSKPVKLEVLKMGEMDNISNSLSQ